MPYESPPRSRTHAPTLSRGDGCVPRVDRDRRRAGLRLKVLAALIDDHVRADEVLVEANRKVGDLLPRQAALEFVATHVGQGEIRLTNRDFNGFVVVAQNGVATGWTIEESR